MNHVKEIKNGQSGWLDFVARDFIAKGDLHINGDVRKGLAASNTSIGKALT